MNEGEELVSLTKSASFKLSFKDLTYRVNSKIPFIKKEPKTVLKSISGDFYGNELTAIIGISGSGKSSLLDCLSGYRQSNVTGTITYNDIPISTKIIKDVSSYFMQEQTLHVFLTVNELMNFAVNMKCRQKLTKDEKELKITDLLHMLNITDRKNDYILNLSGGERKRFQIAMELVDDPKIIFLDEPTTSLDIVASNQFIQYLKDITQQGRMIICTIHQPSASMLNMFDHIYALSDGNCIYQGSSQNLVTFLDEVGLPCPSTYNLADYLLEIANNDYGNQVEQLVEKIQNGTNSAYRKESAPKDSIDIFVKSSNYRENSPSYIRQVSFLIQRLWLTAMRNKSLILMRILIHILLGIFLGLVFKNVGNNGAYVIDNFRFVLWCLLVVIYTTFHSNYVTVPLDFPITKREYFNGWYSVKAYYSSIILFDAPLILVSNILLVTLAYFITNQPHEMHRYLILLGFCLIVSYASQALAIMFSSLLNVQFALFLGTFFLMQFFFFSIFAIFERDAPPIFSPFFKFNFVNMGGKGVVNSILGLNRTGLECHQLYCHYGDPRIFLRDFECEVDLMDVLYLILTYIVVCQVASFIFISYRLKNMRK